MRLVQNITNVLRIVLIAALIIGFAFLMDHYSLENFIIIPSIMLLNIILVYGNVQIRTHLSKNHSLILKQSSVMLTLLMVFTIVFIMYINFNYYYDDNEQSKYLIYIKFLFNIIFLLLGTWFLLLIINKTVGRLIYIWSIIFVVVIAIIFSYSHIQMADAIIIYGSYAYFGIISLRYAISLELKTKTAKLLDKIVPGFAVVLLLILWIFYNGLISLLPSILLASEVWAILKKHKFI